MVGRTLPRVVSARQAAARTGIAARGPPTACPRRHCRAQRRARARARRASRPWPSPRRAPPRAAARAPWAASSAAARALSTASSSCAALPRGGTSSGSAAATEFCSSWRGPSGEAGGLPHTAQGTTQYKGRGFPLYSWVQRCTKSCPVWGVTL